VFLKCNSCRDVADVSWYFGHVTRGSAGNLALRVLEGSVDGLRHQGRLKRQWMDDIEEWSGCSYISLK